MHKFKTYLGLDRGLELGSIIYTPDGKQAIVEEISSVIVVGESYVEVIGEAKIIKN